MRHSKGSMLKRAMTMLTVLTLIPICGFTVRKENCKYCDVPILMYHSVTKINCNDYVISPAAFRADLQYLKDKGYRTVFVRDVIRFATGEGTLPDKPIVLTFDDGFYNNYASVLPLLEEFDAVATFCIVGRYSEKEEGATKRSTVYSYMAPAEIAAAVQTGRVELANHTYDMHCIKNGRKGVRKRPSESVETYTELLTRDVKKNEEVLSVANVKPEVFAYPFGSYSRETPGILGSLGYKAALTSEQGVNRVIQCKIAYPLQLKRFNRPSKYSTEAFFSKIFK